MSPKCSIVVRLDAPKGRHRLEVPDAASLLDLQTQVQAKTAVRVGDQVLSFDPAGLELLPTDVSLSMQQCNIANGTQVFLRVGAAALATLAPTVYRTSAPDERGEHPHDASTTNAPNAAAAAGAGGGDVGAAPAVLVESVSEERVCSFVEPNSKTHRQAGLKQKRDECEWDIEVLHSFTGMGRVIKAYPDQSLKELAELTRQSLRRPADEDIGVVFVDGITVLHDRLSLKQVCRQSPRCLAYLELKGEMAENTQRKARCDYIVSSLEMFNIAVPHDLSDRRFGDDLARQMYSGLMAGRSLRGRVRFSSRKGLECNTDEDSWELCRGRLEYHRTDESKFTAKEQIARWGKATFKKKCSRGVGEVALCMEDNVDSWKSVEDFVNFWESMSEKRLAAYFAGVFCGTRGLLGDSAQVRSARCCIDGTPKLCDINELARPVLEGEGELDVE